MAEGLGRERWAHTSFLCALIANANRDPKKHRPFKPGDFNPYVERPRLPAGKAGHGDVIEVNKETVGLMREAFMGRKEQ